MRAYSDAEAALPIVDLRPHPDAARVPRPNDGDLRALRESLREKGQQDPIDITDQGVILDGLTRWSLLKELGALTIRTRTVDVPEAQQVSWIVGRALERRHLTLEQKRALNDLLRAVVVETTTHPGTGEERRIGMSRPERAEKLGVDKDTIVRWDKGSVVSTTDRPSPTHIRRGGGNTTPYPVSPTKPRAVVGRTRLPKSPKRYAPVWQRHFTRWCRGVLPEDRAFLRQMSTELHDALRRLEMSCELEA